MARSGFGSRFLVGQRGTSPWIAALLTLLLLVVALPLGAAAGVYAERGLREALDPDSPMHRLQPGAGSRAGGRVRASLPVRAVDGNEPPLCEVVHEHYVSGKNGGWRRDASWSRSAGAVVGANVTVAPEEPVRFDPLDMIVANDEREVWLRTVLRDVPSGGRLRAHCVSSGETVFLEGCSLTGEQLAGCGSDALTITTGDGTAQPRIDAHASTVAGQLAGGALALVAVLGYLWYAVRSRPLAEALLRRAGPVPTFDRWPQVFGVVGVAALCALGQGVMVWTANAGDALSRGRPGYLVGLLACAVAGVLAVVVRYRRKNLDLAMAPVLAAPTVPLGQARGGVVEVVVTVRGDARPVQGVFDGAPHAWVDVRVDEVVQSGKSQVTQRHKRECWPARVPVADESGDGWLDLTHAELDLRSRVTTFKQGGRPPLAAALANSPVGALRAGGLHVRWIVEESVLDPGERLYVLGQCKRIEDPKPAGSYRADATVPVVGGSADARLVVHAGTERTLLRSMGLERGYLDLLTGALATVAVGMVATMLALASR